MLGLVASLFVLHYKLILPNKFFTKIDPFVAVKVKCIARNTVLCHFQLKITFLT